MCTVVITWLSDGDSHTQGTSSSSLQQENMEGSHLGWKDDKIQIRLGIAVKNHNNGSFNTKSLVGKMVPSHEVDKGLPQQREKSLPNSET